MIGYVLLKLLPRWLAKILYATGILDAFISYTKYSKLSTESYINGLTDNVELRAVFTYAYGDYGMYMSVRVYVDVCDS